MIVTGGTGACVDGATYWDIGVRGDTGPTNHSSGFTLTPQYSVLTSVIDYTGHNNLAPSALGLVSQYCNGSRMPPEFASGGYQVPPGTNEGTVPVPVFSLAAGRNGRRGKQLGQHEVGSSGDDQPDGSERRLARQLCTSAWLTGD